MIEIEYAEQREETEAQNQRYQTLGRLVKAAEPYNINSIRSHSYTGEFTFGFNYGGEHKINFRIGKNDVIINYNGNPTQATICDFIRRNLEREGVQVIENSSDEGLERLTADVVRLSELSKRLRGEN